MRSIFANYKLLNLLLPAIYRLNKSSKIVYLTFDDGPCIESTEKIIAILNRHNVKATFFCIGDNIIRYPALYRKIIEQGHSIGNHTMYHINGFKHSTKKYISDINECAKLVDSKLFRPPYGRITPCQLRAVRKNGFVPIMWDVIAYDWNNHLSPDDVLRKIQRNSRNGSIIVLHDSKKAAPRTLKMLDTAIHWLKTEGYRFEVISD